MKNNNIIWLILVLLLTASCGNRNDKQHERKEILNNDKVIRINKYLVGKDADIIRAYCKRRNWKMNITQTGLWYMIYEHGNGARAGFGKKATIAYRISLLDGTLCYSSDSIGLKTFIVGKGGVVSGLEEGILLMHQGDKARFIMPPHLAFGLVGDENRVPARSIILYEVELIKISDEP